MILSIVLFAASIIGVAKSADWFLSSAERVGLYFRLPSYILGVILVGFGTSLPELTTSMAAVANGESEIAIANIIGSNIANVLLILGLATIILGTVKFEKNLIDLDLPLLASFTFLFGLLVIDGNLSGTDGGILLFGFVIYIVYSLFYRDTAEYHKGLTRLIKALIQSNKNNIESVQSKPKAVTYFILVFSVISLGLLSKLAVDNLLNIVSQVNIGVGVLSFFALAIGTSLPELVVSLKALNNNQGDLVIGNIIGSCMFNILLVGGVAGLLSNQTVAMPAGYFMLAGLLISVILLIISGVTRRIHIWEGAAFLAVYVALAQHLI
jgi:cation:H+ antiporter